jgi:hypothetical protein
VRSPPPLFLTPKPFFFGTRGKTKTMAEVASEEFVADAPDAEGGAPTSMEKEPIEDGAPVGAPPPPASPTSRAKASAAVDEQDAVIAMLMEKNVSFRVSVISSCSRCRSLPHICE